MISVRFPDLTDLIPFLLLVTLVDSEPMIMSTVLDFRKEHQYVSDVMFVSIFHGMDDLN